MGQTLIKFPSLFHFISFGTYLLALISAVLLEQVPKSLVGGHLDHIVKFFGFLRLLVISGHQVVVCVQNSFLLSKQEGGGAIIVCL